MLFRSVSQSRYDQLDYYHVPDPLLSAISASPIAEFDIDGLAQALKYAYELGSSEDSNARILKLAQQHEIGIAVHQNEKEKRLHSPYGLCRCYPSLRRYCGTARPGLSSMSQSGWTMGMSRIPPMYQRV